MKPIIIISAEDALNHEGISAIIINQRYTEAITQAGGIPVVAGDVRCVEEYSQIADGLLLIEGPLIHASYYGKYYHSFKEMRTISRTRDDLDFALIEAFKKKHKPILGIGRGLEVINVSFEGTLFIDRHEIDKLGKGLIIEKRDAQGKIESIRKDNIYGTYEPIQKDHPLFDILIKEAKS